MTEMRNHEVNCGPRWKSCASISFQILIMVMRMLNKPARWSNAWDSLLCERNYFAFFLETINLFEYYIDFAIDICTFHCGTCEQSARQWTPLMVIDLVLINMVREITIHNRYSYLWFSSTIATTTNGPNWKFADCAHKNLLINKFNDRKIKQ